MSTKKRRVVSCILAMVLIFFVSFGNEVESKEVYPEVVRVGYFDYGGFFGSEDELGGYGCEYLEEIGNYTGWRYEFVYGTWQELLRKLADGEIDLLCPSQLTAERAKLYDYSKYSCGMEYASLFVPMESENIYFGDIASFQGMRVAMVKGSYQNGPFEKYARLNKIKYTEKYYDTWGEADEALKAGEVDARLSGSLRHTSDEKSVLKLAPEPFYFITTKGNAGVIAGVNMAMEKIQTWDANYNMRLYDKYYGSDAANQSAFTREESEYIKNRGSISVAYNTAWPPLSYQKKGEAGGVLPDLLRSMGKKSGMKFTFVPASTMEGMENLVRTGQADVLCYYPRERLQDARKSGMQLTHSYVTVPFGLAWRQGTVWKDLHTVALPESQQGLTQIAQETFKDAQIKYYRDIDACLQAVDSGRVDCVFENDYILAQLLKNRPALESVSASTVQYPLSMGVSAREDPVLLSALNKAMLQLTTDEINATVLDNTVESVDRHTATHMLQRYLPVGFFLLLGFLFLLVFRSKKSLGRYAFIDPLTGYMNQTKFVMECEKRIRDKFNGQYAILCFDVDKFKVINDLHGFRSGNELLRDIARVLKAYVEGEELFCRSSGDNYILLLRNSSLLEQKVGFLLERVCDTAQGLENIRFTVSAGVYVLNETVDGIHIAIDRANLARQTIKHEYKQKLAFYTQEMRQKVLRSQELENSLDKAIINHEFLVYYQPKFDVCTETVIGAEALVRWQPTDGEMIYPDEFIPIFEQSGAIIKLDLYVFRAVCKRLRAWLDKGLSPFPVSVNLSRLHLYQEEFYEEYVEILRLYEIPFYYVELELTESTMFENQHQLVHLVERLKEMGILTSMDDFGSGYSSLNLLKDMPIDSLKIDREFFNTSANTIRGKKIIQSIVAMARQLDIMVVSEGVETREQVDFLREIKCHVAQGFYFSRPLPVEQYEALAFKVNL